MPGPVSDSFDPEFGTAANADEVANAIIELRERLCTRRLGLHLMDIREVVRKPDSPPATDIALTERDLRIIRFCMNRSLESI